MITDYELSRIMDAISARDGVEVHLSVAPAQMDACPRCLTRDQHPDRSLSHATTLTGIYRCRACQKCWMTAWQHPSPGRAVRIGDVVADMMADIRAGRPTGRGTRGRD